MHWSEFQATAEGLLLGTTEGDWRSAISRSYYAVFHFFREFLLARGLNIGRSGQSHFNLCTGLLNCGEATVAAIARRVDDLRSCRAWADYEFGRPIDLPFAQGRVQEARAVVAAFQTVLATVSASVIVDGARRHLQTIGRLGPTP